MPLAALYPLLASLLFTEVIYFRQFASLQRWFKDDYVRLKTGFAGLNVE